MSQQHDDATRTHQTGPRALTGSPEARRQAAMILEALGGVRTTQEAADAMGVALPRYYVLETRALEGFIAALEPRPRGHQVSPERELEKLREEVERIEREMRRYQALYRTAQRALGVPASPAQESETKASRKAKAKATTSTTRRSRRRSRGDAVLAGLRGSEPKASADSRPASDASSAEERP